MPRHVQINEHKHTKHTLSDNIHTNTHCLSNKQTAHQQGPVLAAPLLCQGWGCDSRLASTRSIWPHPQQTVSNLLSVEWCALYVKGEGNGCLGGQKLAISETVPFHQPLSNLPPSLICHPIFCTSQSLVCCRLPCTDLIYTNTRRQGRLIRYHRCLLAVAVGHSPGSPIPYPLHTVPLPFPYCRH